MFVSAFVQPLMLVALPLVALPIVIHLINRQRHRTVQWGAMMFLLDAKRMTRGVARLRYWLIMAMRMLAVGTLIFAVARPLASGRLGVALGGSADTTIIVLDRSASMQQQDVQTGITKQEAALQKLADLMQTVGKSPHLVLIENVENRAELVEDAETLADLPTAGSTDTAADLPAMMQTALEYVVANRSGRTDIWICSDMQQTDWNAGDGRWDGLREGFASQEGVRFYILAYSTPAPQNLAVRVENVRVGLTDQTPHLVLDVVVRRQADEAPQVSVPIEFVINGARSVVNVDMTEMEYRLQGHTVALVGEARSGWGYVELPADANLHDNRFYFVFGDAPRRHTIIVSDEPRVARPMQIAALSPVDPVLSYTAEILSPNQLEGVDWDEASLVLWQARLPEGETGRMLSEFVESGRPVIFFPPAQPGNTQWAGVSWTGWEVADAGEPWQVQTWRGDSGLLSHAQSGVPLPVGRLQVYRYCAWEGDGQPLASFDNGVPMLMRGTLGQGAFYFCATLPGASESTLLRDGVVFYVMMHRALAAGAETRSKTGQLEAGAAAAIDLAGWELVSEPPEDKLSADRALFASVYRNEDRLAAVNRPHDEDLAVSIDGEQIDQLLQGLPYRTVQEQIGSASALASEIWRLFVVLMALALVVEAVLCLPERKLPAAVETNSGLADSGLAEAR
jgi:hypothetical protein